MTTLRFIKFLDVCSMTLSAPVLPGLARTDEPTFTVENQAVGQALSASVNVTPFFEKHHIPQTCRLSGPALVRLMGVVSSTKSPST